MKKDIQTRKRNHLILFFVLWFLVAMIPFGYELIFGYDRFVFITDLVIPLVVIGLLIVFIWTEPRKPLNETKDE